jgi:hypothetical protein
MSGNKNAPPVEEAVVQKPTTLANERTERGLAGCLLFVA